LHSRKPEVKLFGRKDRGATAVAEPEPEADPRPVGEIFTEIESVQAANRDTRDPEAEEQLLKLRHRAGTKLVQQANGRPDFAAPDSDALPAVNGGLPEIAPGELSAGLLRAGILRDGCLLIRGLASPQEAQRMADNIERSFVDRNTLVDGGDVEDPVYREFKPDPPYELIERQWVRAGGGVLAADCPALMYDVVELFDRTGLSQVIASYLGERPAMSVNKSTLRKATPESGGAWHQDGAFMGDVKALNVWISLSHCGDTAPGLDIIPRRIDHIVPTGTEGAAFDWSVSEAVAEETAGEGGTLRPIFEPGDVLLFDDLFLHATAIDPSMTGTRYAVESWFFGPSGFPADYVPLAL
jgi:hypothetical protein